MIHAWPQRDCRCPRTPHRASLCVQMADWSPAAPLVARADGAAAGRRHVFRLGSGAVPGEHVSGGPRRHKPQLHRERYRGRQRASAQQRDDVRIGRTGQPASAGQFARQLAAALQRRRLHGAGRQEHDADVGEQRQRHVLDVRPAAVARAVRQSRPERVRRFRHELTAVAAAADAARSGPGHGDLHARCQRLFEYPNHRHLGNEQEHRRLPSAGRGLFHSGEQIEVRSGYLAAHRGAGLRQDRRHEADGPVRLRRHLRVHRERTVGVAADVLALRRPVADGRHRGARRGGAGLRHLRTVARGLDAGCANFARTSTATSRRSST